MTKVVKWFKRFSFWNKVRLALGSIGIGGEITLYIADSYLHWKIVAAVATGVGLLITYIFVDKNNNDIADIFEKKK